MKTIFRLSDHETKLILACKNVFFVLLINFLKNYSNLSN